MTQNLAINSIASHRISHDTGGIEVPIFGNKGATNFSDTLKHALNEVSDKQDIAADYIGQFLRGEPVELHQVMAAAEEASISLELLVEVRNKFLDAYKTLINMQS